MISSDKIAITTNEISTDFDYAVEVGMKWGINIFELKNVWNGSRVPAINKSQRARIIRIVKEKGIVISAISPGGFITHRSNPMFECYKKIILPETIKFARELNSKIIIVICPYREEGDLPTVVPNWLVKDLKECSMLAKDAGLTICLENLTGTFADTGKNILSVLEAVNIENFKLNWDPGNCVKNEINPFPDTYNLLRHFVAHLHMKDVKVDHETGQRIFVPIGEGFIDWKGQIEAMIKDGYNGYFTIETHCLPNADNSYKNYMWIKNKFT